MEEVKGNRGELESANFHTLSFMVLWHPCMDRESVVQVFTPLPLIRETEGEVVRTTASIEANFSIAPMHECAPSEACLLLPPSVVIKRPE